MWDISKRSAPFRRSLWVSILKLAHAWFLNLTQSRLTWLSLLSTMPSNYVVQHLLDQNIPGVEETLLNLLEGKFASLSCNKYSSNVVEKFFVKSGENSSKIIIELITSPNASMLLVDPFANYVIQKALKVATVHFQWTPYTYYLSFIFFCWVELA